MNKKYTYRFKTEDELRKEFGCRWQETCYMNNEGFMDYLLGTEVDVPDCVIDRKGDVYEYFEVINKCTEHTRQVTWSIIPNLIMKLDTMPTYERKTFIYE